MVDKTTPLTTYIASLPKIVSLSGPSKGNYDDDSEIEDDAEDSEDEEERARRKKKKKKGGKQEEAEGVTQDDLDELGDEDGGDMVGDLELSDEDE